MWEKIQEGKKRVPYKITSFTKQVKKLLSFLFSLSIFVTQLSCTHQDLRLLESTFNKEIHKISFKHHENKTKPNKRNMNEFEKKTNIKT